MAEIRTLRRDDMPEVASLVELAFRSGSRVPSPGLAPYLERILIEHPWVDPELPSLVAVGDDGRVVGCLGSHVRRFRFDGEGIRVAVSGQLVADPSVRRRAVGALLMQRYLEGPQELTITDTASKPLRRMWEGLGGETVHLGRIGWLRPFQPFRFASTFLLDGHPRSRDAALALAAPLDVLASWVGRRYLTVRRPDVSTEPLTPATIVENLAVGMARRRLHPDYDTAFLGWIFRELALVESRGTPVGYLIRDRNRRLLGWYLYFLRPGGISQVLQVAGAERDIDGILDHLFHHARENGSAALQGRLEPHLVEGLSERGCILHPSGYRLLVHARDREMVHAFGAGDAFLSRLDGDWWLGLRGERFSPADRPNP